MEFLIKSISKRGFTCRVTWRQLTWRTGQGDMARETNPGCDAGTEATWQRQGGPRRRRTGRGQVAGRPRGHVGARVGRHVWLDIEGERRILIGESVPLFNHILSLYFLRVGLCSHTVSVLQDAWQPEER